MPGIFDKIQDNLSVLFNFSLYFKLMQDLLQYPDRHPTLSVCGRLL
jgi:hypothetical protein